MKRMLTFISKKYLYLGITRYLLGIWMLPYAITKILRTQFVLLGQDWVQSQSFEDMPGSTLAWAFLGHSAWFQVLLGFLELIPALLLLFRRTTLLGATLMLPMTLNVFLINYALELWPGTKLISGILLALNILVLVFEWARVKLLLSQMINWGIRFRLTKIEVAVNLILISAISYFAVNFLIEIRNQSNVLTGDWLNSRPVEWVLEREQSGDSIFASRDLKVYFGPHGMYHESGPSKYKSRISYTADTVKHTMSFKYGDGNVVNCKYRILSNGGLKIDRIVNPSKHTNVIQYFRKRVINEDLDTE